LIAYEDRLRADKNYVKAAMSATAILFKVYDSPDLRELKLCKCHPSLHVGGLEPNTGRCMVTAPEEEAERKRAAKKAQKAGSKAKKGEYSP
jgi:peptide alpha-N-acetyltransferase